MQTYVSLVKFTQHGLQTMKEKGIERAEMVKQNVKAARRETRPGLLLPRRIRRRRDLGISGQQDRHESRRAQRLARTHPDHHSCPP